MEFYFKRLAQKAFAAYSHRNTYARRNISLQPAGHSPGYYLEISDKQRFSSILSVRNESLQLKTVDFPLLPIPSIP